MFELLRDEAGGGEGKGCVGDGSEVGHRGRERWSYRD